MDHSDKSEDGPESAPESSNEDLSDDSTDGSETGSKPEPENIPRDEPIYEGARINIMESILAIVAVFISNKITQRCLHHIFMLTQLFCPAINKCITSLFKFKDFFQNEGPKVNRNYYCTRCYRYIGSTRDTCKKCKKLPLQNDYFIHISIIEQIQSLFSRPDFPKHLKYRFIRKKKTLKI